MRQAYYLKTRDNHKKAKKQCKRKQKLRLNGSEGTRRKTDEVEDCCFHYKHFYIILFFDHIYYFNLKIKIQCICSITLATSNSLQVVVLRRWLRVYFSGGSVAKTPCSQCRGPGFDPWSEKQILELSVCMLQLKIPHAATKMEDPVC